MSSTVGVEPPEWDDAEPDQLSTDARRDVQIDASARVGKYVREHGGRLLIWFAPFGPTSLWQKVSTSAPAGGPEFTEHDAVGFSVCLQAISTLLKRCGCATAGGGRSSRSRSPEQAQGRP